MIKDFTFKVQILAMGKPYAQIVKGCFAPSASEARLKIKEDLEAEFKKEHKQFYKFTIGKMEMI